VRVVGGAWEPATGWSPDVTTLAADAASGGRRTLVLAFADRESADAVDALAALREALPLAVIVGCSTAGQILGEAVSPAPLVVAVAHFAQVQPVAAWASLTDADDALHLGRTLGERLQDGVEGQAPHTVFVLADGVHINGTALVDGLGEALPGIGISGGLAGDGERFERTWVYADGAAREDAVAAVALCGGSLEVGFGSAGGWEGFGPYRLVSRSDGNVLHELDGRPALTLYKEYLGDRADHLPASALLFPLLIRSPEGDVELVRTILGVDEDRLTMTFAGDVPEGWSARLMRTTLDRLIDAAGVAAEGATGNPEPPDLVVAVSCVGRRLVLGQRTDEEVELAASVVGPNSMVVGFYSYGEISPATGVSEVHNQTMTITTFREIE
jgi:hypothetical protein